MLNKCKNCEGKGYIFIKELGIKASCTVCNGKGRFGIPGNAKLCPHCNGKGSLIIITSLGFPIYGGICGTCLGSGFIENSEK